MKAPTRASEGHETMRRIHLSILFGTIAASPGCIIDHGLGETASESSSGSGPGNDTADSGTTGGTQGSDTVDPSITSTGGDDPSFTSGAESDGTDTESFPFCPSVGGTVVMSDVSLDPAPSDSAVLTGSCSASVFDEEPIPGIHEWQIELSCTLSGRLDDDPSVVDLPSVVTLDGTVSSDLQDWIPDIEGQPLSLRLVLDRSGESWNRYVVLYRGDQVMIDAVHAEHIDPLDGPRLLEDIAAMLGAGTWHDTLEVGLTDADCAGVQTFCLDHHQAVAIGWNGGGDEVIANPNEHHTFDSGVPGLSYEISVVSAIEHPMPCEGLRPADYHFVVEATEL